MPSPCKHSTSKDGPTTSKYDEGASTNNSTKPVDYKDCIITAKMEIESEKIIEEMTKAEVAYIRKLQTNNQDRKANLKKAFDDLLDTLVRTKAYTNILHGVPQDLHTIADNIKKQTVEEIDDDVEGPNCKRIKLDESSSKAENGSSNDDKKSKHVEKVENGNEDKTQNDVSVPENPSPDVTSTSQDKLVEAIQQPSSMTGAILRPYQLYGVKWLVRCYLKGVNCILADEMGLGKTIQCIATIAHFIEKKILGPFLVIAPLSTLSNWVKETRTFCPELTVSLYHGTPGEREILRRQYKKAVVQNTLVVTSYEIIMKDAKFLQSIQWRCLIVDEAHRIKNFRCKLIEKLNMCRSLFRILLTGTPLQNNLHELWSLLNFIMPDVFFNLAAFEEWFQPAKLEGNYTAQEFENQEQRIVAIIHEILSLFLLRRLKKDVEINIPGKKELLVYCPMSKLQVFMYKAAAQSTLRRLVDNNDTTKKFWEDKEYQNIFTSANDWTKECDSEQKERQEKGKEKKIQKRRSFRNRNSVEHLEKNQCMEKKEQKNEYEKIKEYGDGVVGTSFRLKTMNPLMLLRKIVNHPYLVEWPVDASDLMVVNDYIINHCGKIRVLDALLLRLKKDGHKVLLFSQMTEMLDILESYLEFRCLKYERLDGSMGLEARAEAIETYSTDDEVFVFLLSTRAGGQGINLTAADTVIIYDSDWNPQMDLQAQDRCHRIGQSQPVIVYRLVSKGTVDEKIITRASGKKKLEKMIIEKGRFSTGQVVKSTFSMSELMELLNSKEEEYFASDANNGEVFTSDQLNELLNRDDLFSRHEDNAQEKSDAVYKVVLLEES